MQIESSMTNKMARYNDLSMKQNGIGAENKKEEVKFNQLLESDFDNPEADDSGVKDKLTLLVEDIDDLKKKLEEQLTLKNLNEYKENVRQFVEYYTQNEMEVREETVQNNRTYANKKYTIVDNINKNLEGMTEDLLSTNRGHLELLSKMGEINGLIINLVI